MKKEKKLIIKRIKRKIFSNSFMENCRKSDRDFTRKRKMPFPSLILFMINLVKQTLQKELTHFISLVSSGKIKNITKSAFSQSRLKFKPEAFIELSDVIINDIYNKYKIKKWNKFLLIGVDGSVLSLPESKELIKKYGKKASYRDVIIPQARISTCYDLLNDLIITSQIDTLNEYELSLILRHLNILKEKIKHKCLIILDRGYGATWLMLYLLKEKKDFVIRLKSNFSEEVKNFSDSDEKSRIIEIVHSPYTSKDQLKELNMNFENFKIRLVKVILDNGEIEILATSLLDEEKYPSQIFKELYFTRWGIETNYDHLKNNIQLENFTGKSEVAIKQDFFANMFIMNLQSIIINDAQEELEESNKKTKREYKINRNLSLGYMKDKIIKIFLKDSNIEYEELRQLFKINPCPIRKGRKFPRIHYLRARKYPMTKKKAV
jgi:hypothetical protein